MFGICNLAIVPLRAEASDRSEQVSQLLFGEHFKILEVVEKWTYIEMAFDGYKGWIDTKQFMPLTDKQYQKIEKTPSICSADLLEYAQFSKIDLLPIPLGSSLTFLKSKITNTLNIKFDGEKVTGVQPKSELIKTAFLYLNAPYLWGGKSPFGIDCSGFSQMVYKINGYALLRDASQQATQGEPLSFIEESEPGDLAFFDNEEGTIVHVGIMMRDNYIIHASGKVRIDRLDHLGIYNAETNRHTHKLRVIKKII